MTRRELRYLRSTIIEYKGYINIENKYPSDDNRVHAETIAAFQSVIDDARERLDQAGVAHY